MKPSNIEFYKEVYYKELERRNSLNTEIALQGTILVAFISGIFLLFTNIKTEWLLVYNVLSVLCSYAMLMGLISAFYLMRSYYDFLHQGRKFTYLPKMKVIDDYYQKVDEEEFNSFLKSSFIEACDSHTSLNDDKSRLLTKSSYWMSFLMMFSALIMLVFIGNHLTSYPKSLKKYADQKPKQSAPAASPASATAAATATATRPVNSTPTTKTVGRARQQHAIPDKVGK